MARENALIRIYNAARFKLERAVDNFTAPYERSIRRDTLTLAEQRADEERLTRQIARSEIMADGALLPGGPSGPVKPPDEEYKDLPISLWIDWNVKVTKAALVDHVLGNFGRSGMLTEAMLGDDRIQTASDGRIKNLTKCVPVFVPADVAGGEEIVKELDNLWDEILPEETVEELMRWAIFEGFALAEIIWDAWPNRDAWVPRIKVWHPFYVYYRIDIRRYVAITMDGPIEIDPDDPKWFLFVPHGAYRGWIMGRCRSVAIPWLVRQFALRDLARFSEVHGLPIRQAKYPAQAPAEDKARFVAGIRNIGAESVLGVPIQAGSEAAAWGLDLVEAKDTSWKAFESLRNMCDSSITLSIRGTNLTTSVGDGNSGNRAAADVHQDEDDDYAESDRRKLMRPLRRHLLRWYCIFNHGSTDLVPGPKSQFVKPRGESIRGEFDAMERAAKTVVQMRAAGAPVDALQIYERADVPLIKGQEKAANDPSKMLAPPTTVSAPQGEKPLEEGGDRKSISAPKEEKDREDPDDEGGSDPSKEVE